MHLPLKTGLSLSFMLGALAACSRGTTERNQATGPAANSTPATTAVGWVGNGASACGKILSPDFLGQLFSHPAGHARKLSQQACTYHTDANNGHISITLSNGGPQSFKAQMPYLAGPVPLPGVGDEAVRTLIGIDAIKGRDRSCRISAGSDKLTGEALAQKLGEICNRLFALP